MVDIQVYDARRSMIEKPPILAGKTIAQWLLDSESRISTYCRGAIQSTFAEDLVEDSHWIIIAAVAGRPRAFAFLERKTRGTLYLHLICAAVSHPMHRRSHDELGLFGDNVGGHLLKFIKEFAVFKKFNRVQLSAIIPVITLYYKFGWRFIHRCNERENPAIAPAVGAFYKALRPIWSTPTTPDKIDQLVDDFIEKSSSNSQSAWFQLRILLEQGKFSGATTSAGHTIFTQPRLAARGVDAGRNYEPMIRFPTRDELEDEDMTETRQLANVDTSEHGYEMLWCAPRQGVGGAAKGGRRTRHKRRKRRKRRRRRTRRRRRRTHRRRR
jgi:hypothetical protein